MVGYPGTQFFGTLYYLPRLLVGGLDHHGDIIDTVDVKQVAFEHLDAPLEPVPECVKPTESLTDRVCLDAVTVLPRPLLGGEEFVQPSLDYAQIPFQRLFRF